MNDFQTKLRQLKTTYSDVLPEKIETLEYLWRQYLADHDPHVLETFQRSIHSLAGSGSTFGFAAISQAARALQSQLKQWQAAGHNPDRHRTQHIQQLLEELVQQMRQAGNTASVQQNPQFSSGKGSTVLLAAAGDDKRQRLRRHLAAMGHHVLEARDAAEVEAQARHKPDLVLLHARLPDADCRQLVSLVKQGRSFVPVIFLTDLNDADLLTQAIEAGGDDFLPEQVSPRLLDAKIQAFQRIADVYRTLKHYRDQNEEEMELARQVFHSVLQQNQAAPVEVEQWNVAAGHFSGDILLHADCPDGGLNLFLGDFTGHGLPAAVGTLIAAGIVQGMSRKNIAADKILAEINRKLHTVLPTGRYCAAGFVHLNPARDQVTLWNCGLPEALLVAPGGKITRGFPSRHLPLGITADQGESCQGEQFPVEGPGSLLLMSDGITEALSPDEQLFGSDRLLRVIAEHGGNEQLLRAIKNAVLEHMGPRPPADDISLMCVKLGICRA